MATPSAGEVFFILLTIILARYFLFSGGVFFLTAVLGKDRWRSRRLHDKAISRRQIQREIVWSILASAIFAAVGTAGWIAWARGYTRVYLDVAAYGWVYFFASLPILILLQDAYFYFAPPPPPIPPPFIPPPPPPPILAAYC